MRRVLLAIALAILARPAHGQDAAPFLVEAAFDAGWVYPGQVVTYTVTAYSDTARDVSFDLPAFEGFWQSDARAFGGSATVDGKQYNAAIYQVSLYPQQAGTLSVGAAQAEFAETVFSAGAIRLSNTTTLEVLELPPTTDEFSGLVGAVNAQFSVEPTVVGLGEPVTVTLRLNGSANLAQLPRPDLIVPEGWRIYDEPGQSTTEFDDSLLTQTRIVRWRAIPDRAGRAQISTPPIVIFNPATGYQTLNLAPVPLEALPGPNGELSREARTQIVESLLVPAAPQTAAGHVPLFVWLIAPLVAGIVIGGRAGLAKWRQVQAEARKRDALKRATTRLRNAARNDGELAQIEAAVSGYFTDHTWQIADEPDAAALLIAVESERYHPNGASKTPMLAKQAAELLRRIEAARNG